MNRLLGRGLEQFGKDEGLEANGEGRQPVESTFRVAVGQIRPWDVAQ